MATSRYSDNATLFSASLNEPRHYATWTIPESVQGYNVEDIMKGQQTLKYTWNFGDRLDKLAAQYLGDSQLWWLIAYVNDISYPLAIVPGTLLRIPLSARPLLEKLGLV